ncbi:hypothetical protein Q5424_05835 [Conexibacter sp. JD483]|uniref:hypothetical protein n=1 Tax=unclassified Conexibacter TaxID=2627773 RepID=UPI0027277F20|nr:MULTISPECIES: hypothetical protein [unclassified Conexibacter]MDO8185980.1 hypothetical protein [Conexibacter sp. CPCC 205706]MDO8199471.1 hypothetical protein [Conexibacter sp. CPCC 205762]MDR9368589.1 hypothetical protein [Conexibacter sp. JD483]
MASTSSKRVKHATTITNGRVRGYLRALGNPIADEVPPARRRAATGTTTAVRDALRKQARSA